jgi:hypothetical protein
MRLQRSQSLIRLMRNLYGFGNELFFNILVSHSKVMKSLFWRISHQTLSKAGSGVPGVLGLGIPYISKSLGERLKLMTLVREPLMRMTNARLGGV